MKEIEVRKTKIIAYVNSYYSWTPGKDSPKMIIEWLDKYIKENYKLISENNPKNKIIIYERND